MFGVKLKFAHGRERVVDEERPGPVLFRRLMQTIAAVDSLMRSDIWYVMVKMFKWIWSLRWRMKG